MLLQPQLFFLEPFSSNDKIKTESTISEANATEKYLRSGLKPEQAERYLQNLLDFMETEKPYCDPDLTLPALSDKLAISRNHLTEIINEKLDKNFFEFVNTYRVEEVKKLLADSSLSYLNLYALGLKAGFKSKTAFNNNFKKITGLTPSKWKQQYTQLTPETEVKPKEVLT
jgi:YesN/AraC family two-component response regulator